MLAVALLAGSAACGRDQPLGPGRAVPERPAGTLSPACDPGLGGVTHVDSVKAAETWSRSGNPHHVDQTIHVEGAGVLTLAPGVLVCFGSSGALDAANGGRLVADGLDTARIVLTATDPANGWGGVHLRGTPASASSLKNAVIEYTRGDYALSTHDYHAAYVDSTTVRQNERGLYLWGRVTSLRRSRVDTVTSATYPAVTLGSHVVFEQTVVRGAAGVGLAVLGTNGISLLGGRIEGSGGVGLKVTTTGPGFVTTQPVRVVGGASYPAELVVSAFPRIYTSVAQQDSLLGNARDTLVVTGGILQQWAYPAPALPWHVTGNIVVQYYGILLPMPGAVLAFDPSVTLTATNGGRVVARGTPASPILFTRATAGAWGGLVFSSAASPSSYLTNVRVEHVAGLAVNALDPHPLVIDSSVFRQNGSAVVLESSNSRLSRSRVDTTSSLGYAVRIDLATLESTLIRGSAGVGLVVGSNLAQVLSCEVRQSAGNGIELWAGGEVHNCNLAGNGGAGVYAANLNSVNAENNWWGDAAGPTGPNGDGVSGPVDHTAWLLSPYVLPYVP
ncbi:MAG TPA: right-handed parallel beta-helix repeat-containing protein [Longimicrobium sp.]|nr:right-handed parallel beta-helix repeat-containing protein [Longimicrobium sp.]